MLTHGSFLLVGVFVAAGWFGLESSLNSRAIEICLPDRVSKKLREQIAKDPELAKTMHINGMAFLHGAITSILALTLHLSGALPDLFNSTHPMAYVLSYILLGYFIWDVIRCVQYYKTFGATFLAHGIMVLIGLVIQAGAAEHQCLGMMCNIVLTEISTPFLHIRYALVKTGETKTMFFKVINLAFISLFVWFRVLWAPFSVLYAYQVEMIDQGLTPNMHLARRIAQCVINYSWFLLNLIWGLSLVRSQARQMFGKGKKAE